MHFGQMTMKQELESQLTLEALGHIVRSEKFMIFMKMSTLRDSFWARWHISTILAS